MRPNPYPSNRIAVEDPNGAKPLRDTDGVNCLTRMYTFEHEPRMGRIPRELKISFPRTLSDLFRQGFVRSPESFRCARSHSFAGSSSVTSPRAISSSASSARLASTSCDLLNCSSHSRSSANSERSHSPMRSCSSGGSRAASANAVSRTRVIQSSIAPLGRITSVCSRQHCHTEGSWLVPAVAAREFYGRHLSWHPDASRRARWGCG